MLSFVGQAVMGLESILNEILPAQFRPGADLGSGFSGIGATHSEPSRGPASPEKARTKEDTMRPQRDLI